MDNTRYLANLIESVIPPKRKVTNGGINFNCPLCTLRGQARPDHRMRCGVKIFGDGSMKVNCFNCKLATKWEPGDYLPQKIKLLLTHLGCTDRDVLFAHKVCHQLANSFTKKEKVSLATFNPSFIEKELPSGAKEISYWLNLIESDIEFPNMENFANVYEYALSRGVQCDYHWSPDWKLKNRLIIPFTYKGMIVGYVGRSCDPTDTNRYYADTQPNYIFGNENFIRQDRRIVIVTEGVFDGLSVNGASMLGAKMTEEQAIWLKESNKRVIILPDLQKSGLPLVDAANEYGFEVSIPNWEYGIKDANQAFLKYGKLWTIKSIVDNSTTNRMKINFLSKKYMVNE